MKINPREQILNRLKHDEAMAGDLKDLTGLKYTELLPLLAEMVKSGEIHRYCNQFGCIYRIHRHIPFSHENQLYKIAGLLI